MTVDFGPETVRGLPLADLPEPLRAAFEHTQKMGVVAAREQLNNLVQIGSGRVTKRRIDRDRDRAHTEHLVEVLDRAFQWRGPFGINRVAIHFELVRRAGALAGDFSGGTR